MKNKNTVKWAIGVIVITIIFLFWFVYYNSQKPVVNVSPEALTGIQKSQAPWPSEINNLKARLKEIGLPALTQEGTVLHTHEHLDIFIDGQTISVPASIGIDDAAGFIAPIHTHDSTAIIHVESPTLGTFTLGQFFDIWGVLFTKDCIGGYCSQGDKNLEVFVNGNLFQGDPRSIELKEHEEIVVTYGTLTELPNPIIPSFNFPVGY